MNQVWQNIILEIGLFVILGFLYYFYQKRKILNNDEKKKPAIISFMLESCLEENKDNDDSALEALIIYLDDCLQNNIQEPDILAIKSYIQSTNCSDGLRNILNDMLEELEQDHAKK